MKTFLVTVITLASLSSFASSRIENGRDEKSINISETSSRFDVTFKVPVYKITETRVPVQRDCSERQCHDVTVPYNESCPEQRCENVVVPESRDCSYDQCHTVTVPVERDCSERSCTTVGGNGKGEWHGFFNVPKEQKASALSSAIRGIGKSTAEKIVEQNLLNHKPDNWEAFKSTMRSIDSALGGQVYYNVIEMYGSDNKRNLGYATTESCTTIPRTCTDYVNRQQCSRIPKTCTEYVTRQSCHTIPRTCTYHRTEQQCTTIPRTCTDYVTHEDRKLLKKITRNVTVSVKDQVLQSFEQDKVTISAGVEAQDFQVSTKGCNTYSQTVENGGRTLELTGERVLCGFPVHEAVVSLSKKADGTLTTQIDLPAKYFNGEDKFSELQVFYQVCKIERNGRCKPVTKLGMFKMDRPSLKLTGGKARRGSVYTARIQFRKLHSTFYNNAKTAVKESPVFRAQ